MPLKVWLPLIQNNSNQGLLDLTPTNLGNISFISGGKFGNCLSAGTGAQVTNGVSYPTNLVNELGTKFSCSIWVKPLGNHVHYSGTFISSGNWNVKCWAFGVNQDNSEVDVFSRGYRKYITCSVPTNTWTHLCCTSDNGLVKLYKNGEYVGERTEYATLDSDASNFCVGRETYANGYFSFNGNITDVRIYDEVLSLKQIKLLSQGLVAHYQLNDPYSTSNLIPNGNGDLGASGWSVSYNISTTEIPAVQTRIKASYYTNINNTYIPITQGTSYTFSVWLKQKESSGKTYPSFYPYDVDKKFIYHQSCADGFGAAYTTTLAQPLKKGDTVIYATDLSAWTTATNNYYFYCAIFGYKDSFGHTYADMTYTGDSPAFGTYSDKSHIDKTNNTITLNAPFTGEDRPAGTLICQATQGNGYYYPVGGIDVTAISDWTLKSATITPSTVNRLKYAKYIQFYAYPNAYYAGISLTDNQYMPEIVYDSSGYNYHGVSVDTEIASISPRNSFSTDFNSVTSYIEFPNLSFMPTMLPDEWTFSFWVYNNDAGSRSILFSNFNLGGVGSNSFGFEKTTGELLRVAYVSGKFDRIIPNSTLTVRVWTHIAVSKTKSHLVSVYRNGVLIDSYTNSNCASSGVLYRMGRDSRTDSTMYRGCLSDFRIYTTVLSADDILALYNAPVSIANNGTMFTQGEFVEG